MARILPGRTTHEHEGSLVVFLIGMRINKPWRPDQWGPVFQAMPGMLSELARDPGSGLLGSRLVPDPRGPWIVQYWESQEKLYAYASNPDAAHRPAWTAFNTRARNAPGAVGIWHETFVVSRAESMYVGMPVSGLAAATRSVPVGKRSERAAQRLASGATEPAAAYPDRVSDASGPAVVLPAGPQVRLPVAIAVVLASVVLALVVVGAVVSVQPDRVGGGPALAPPSAPADPYRFSVDSSRRLTYQELKVVLPGAPFTCLPQAEPAPAGLLALVSCNAVVHRDYDKAGDDWYAEVGVALPKDAMVDDADLHQTTEQIFSAMLDGLYSADSRPLVKKRTWTQLGDIAPGGGAYAVYGDVYVSRPGLKTDHDRLLVVAVKLASGQHAFYFSARPTDASAAVTEASRAALASVSAKP